MFSAEEILKGNSLMKWQNQKHKHIKLMDNHCHVLNFVHITVLIFQALSSNGNVNGSIIYLATDGQENRAPYIADVQPTLLSNGITVHSLAISNAADPKIQDLAFASGGKSYFYSASTANSTALLDALTEPFKDLSSDALIRVFMK